MAMIKWSDFIPPEYAPVAYGLGAAAAGGGLGWLYDWLRGKKHTARRIGIGALIGGLGGLGYGQSVLKDHLIKRDHESEIRGSSKQREDEVSRLKDIAENLGVDEWSLRNNNDPVSLNGEITNKLTESIPAPSGDFSEDDLARIKEELISRKKDVIKAIKFVRGLNGQDVIVVPKRR